MWSLISDPQKYVTFQRGYLMFPWLRSARLHRVLSFAALFLLNVEHPVAARAGVVRILEVVHEEGDQAAAQHQPAAEQRTFEQTSQTGWFPLQHMTWRGLLKGSGGLSQAPTRSRWRVSTWATHTSRLCRWRWSWPAAGRKCMWSCRGSSPAPCRSSRTSASHPWAQGLDLHSLLFALQRWKVRWGWNISAMEPTMWILLSCGWVYLGGHGCFPEGWMGCGGGKPSHHLPDYQLEQRQSKVI